MKHLEPCFDGFGTYKTLNSRKHNEFNAAYERYSIQLVKEVEVWVKERRKQMLEERELGSKLIDNIFDSLTNKLKWLLRGLFRNSSWCIPTSTPGPIICISW